MTPDPIKMPAEGRPAPFKMPKNLKMPCDACGKLKTREELTVRGLYAFCEKCDKGDDDE